MSEHLFFIGEQVRPQEGAPDDYFLALVDADSTCCTPHRNLISSSGQILLTSPLKTQQDRKWLIQYAGAHLAVYMMDVWSRYELYVTAFVDSTSFENGLHPDTLCRHFITRFDITLRRLQAATHVCGHIPRTCFEAAQSLNNLRGHEAKLRNAINNIFTLSLEVGEPLCSKYSPPPSLGSFTSLKCDPCPRWPNRRYVPNCTRALQKRGITST